MFVTDGSPNFHPPYWLEEEFDQKSIKYGLIETDNFNLPCWWPSVKSSHR